MNGSEVEIRAVQTNPLLDAGTGELTVSEKMDLLAWDDSPYAKAIKKLMRFEISKARDEAMDCDPADKKKQRALMTIAHAQEKFYKNILGQIAFEKASHLADVKAKQAQEDLKDQQKLEEIILQNQT